MRPVSARPGAEEEEEAGAGGREGTGGTGRGGPGPDPAGAGGRGGGGRSPAMALLLACLLLACLPAGEYSGAVGWGLPASPSSPPAHFGASGLGLGAWGRPLFAQFGVRVAWPLS